jgi:hypothetical protein
MIVPSRTGTRPLCELQTVHNNTVNKEPNCAEADKLFKRAVQTSTD